MTLPEMPEMSDRERIDALWEVTTKNSAAIRENSAAIHKLTAQMSELAVNINQLTNDVRQLTHDVGTAAAATRDATAGLQVAAQWWERHLRDDHGLSP